MSKKFFKKFSLHESVEGPIESGQTLGMTPQEVLDTYLDRRNSLVTLLRIYTRRSLSDVSKELGISMAELEKIEKSDDLIPFQLVPSLARIFKIELRPLLLLLGHAQRTVEDWRIGEPYQFAWAARYSGPELTEQEKIDLDKLLRMILERVKKQEGEK